MTTEADEGGTGITLTGACSLREAINALNTASDVGGCDGSGYGTDDTIEFNIPGGGVKTIQPNPRLPNLNVPMTIDGYTQSGAQENTNSSTSGNGLNSVIRIEINGALQPNGPVLRVRGGSTIIRGLAIYAGPSDGIHLQSAGLNVIAGNYIGTDASGTQGDDLDGDGVFVDDTGGPNRIGGAEARDRNLIAGSERVGIRVKDNLTRIVGNLIGTARNGLEAFPNEQNGITVSAGADTSIDRNVISGNEVDGVVVSIEKNPGCGCPFGSVENTSIANNFIGVDVTGNRALPNGKNGVQIQFFANFTSVDDNVISANGQNGIQLDLPGNTDIFRNLIGVGANRTTQLGNRRDGIFSQLTFDDSIDVTIGGDPAEGNVIAFNRFNGVNVCNCAIQNRIQGNSIFSNGLLGIDLDGDGITANDDPADDDSDDGANFLQNFPEVTTQVDPDQTTDVTVVLNSTPDTEFEIEFFLNRSCDPSDFGEGERFLRRSTLTTDGNGDGLLIFINLPPSNGFPFLTATMTDPDGNTSEFSQCAGFGSKGPDEESSTNNDPNNDDKEDEEDDKPKETEEQRQNRERTNNSNKSEYSTEGNVLGVERTADGKHLLVTIGLTKNEKLTVQVTCVELKCPDIRVGDYLEADGYQNGVGDPNDYFIAEDVTVRRNGKKVN